MDARDKAAKGNAAARQTLIKEGILPEATVASDWELLLAGWDARRSRRYSEAARYWTSLAHGGDANAQYGMVYINQVESQTRDAQTIAWCRAAAEAGHPAAQYLLGDWTFRGGDVPQDETEGLRLFFASAEQGYAQAQNALCGLSARSTRRHGSGEYTIAGGDFDTAMRWCRAAAEQGHATAASHLGRLLYTGDNGTGRDEAAAQRWYEASFKSRPHSNPAEKALASLRAAARLRKSAERGEVEAQFALGNHYDRDDTIARVPTAALYWYTAAAQQSHVDAQFRLAEMYELGDGVDENRRRSRKWYAGAEAQGHAEAAARLAAPVTLPGDPAPTPDAVQKFEAAVKAHLVDGDRPRALELHREAAAAGHYQSMRQLGVAYFHGLDVPKDRATSQRWFRQALELARPLAERGDPQALSVIGTSYLAGWGVSKDPGEATRWYLAAVEAARPGAEAGDVRLQVMIGSMYKEGLGVARDGKEAARWLRLAAEAGDPSGQYLLGMLYFQGQGVQLDRDEGMKWFRAAAEQNYPSAKVSLDRIKVTGHLY